MIDEFGKQVNKQALIVEFFTFVADWFSTKHDESEVLLMTARIRAAVGAIEYETAERNQFSDKLIGYLVSL